jgi:hypothetical protein
MREDYLWDKSGDPDDEIVRFEKLFQEVKFDEKMTPVPEFRPPRNSWTHRFWVPVSIAASIAFLLLTGTLVFIKWNGSRTIPPVPVTSASPTFPVNSRPVNSQIADVTPNTNDEERKPVGVTPPENVAIIRRNRTSPVNARRIKPRPLQLESEREKGERAKAELMLALHIAGSKLNLVRQKLTVNKEAGPSS